MIKMLDIKEEPNDEYYLRLENDAISTNVIKVESPDEDDPGLEVDTVLHVKVEDEFFGAEENKYEIDTASSSNANKGENCHIVTCGHALPVVHLLNGVKEESVQNGSRKNVEKENGSGCCAVFEPDLAPLDDDSSHLGAHAAETSPRLGKRKVSNDHQQIQKEERPFKCDYSGCTAAYKKLSHLVPHIRKHTGEKPFKCIYSGCIAAFTQSGSLKLHASTHTGEKPFKCDFSGCKAAYKKLSHLAPHKRKHIGEKPFKCDFSGCMAEFPHSCSLKAHKLFHTGERPFKCDYSECIAAFKTSNELMRHSRMMHSGDRPFKCDFNGCTASFIVSSNLKSHARIHTGEMPFKCKFSGCTAAFNQSGNLHTHKLTHSGEKPFKCDYGECQAAYKALSHLVAHKRIHTGEKPFKCDYSGCEAVFAYSVYLTRHRQKHTARTSGYNDEFPQSVSINTRKVRNFGDKPFKCDYSCCKAAYSQLSHLKKHQLLHTGQCRSNEATVEHVSI